MSRQPFFDEHREVSRRYFLRQSMELGGGVGALGLGAGGLQAAEESEAVAKARAARPGPAATARRPPRGAGGVPRGDGSLDGAGHAQDPRAIARERAGASCATSLPR